VVQPHLATCFGRARLTGPSPAGSDNLHWPCHDNQQRQKTLLYSCKVNYFNWLAARPKGDSRLLNQRDWVRTRKNVPCRRENPSRLFRYRKEQKKLDFRKKCFIMVIINKGPRRLAARFRSEGKSICRKWQPEVWNYENFFERRVSQWLMES
jgi:hypothetical protein